MTPKANRWHKGVQKTEMSTDPVIQNTYAGDGITLESDQIGLQTLKNSKTSGCSRCSSNAIKDLSDNTAKMIAREKLAGIASQVRYGF